jgi:hypothetical protein
LAHSNLCKSGVIKLANATNQDIICQPMILLSFSTAKVQDGDSEENDQLMLQQVAKEGSWLPLGNITG